MLMPHMRPASRAHIARSSVSPCCGAMAARRMKASVCMCIETFLSSRGFGLLSRRMNDDLRLALALADDADAITMRYFQSARLAVRTKSDRTPVSEADEAVERMIRERLERERPDDGILGEEFGSRGNAARRWIIDPIDATKNYVRGIPIFATLIALDGLVGVVSAPAMGRRWWASRGDGAFCNGKLIHVSIIDEVSKSQLCYDDVQGFEQFGLGDRFL